MESKKATNLIDDATFFSLTIDGATNVSSVEQECLHLHWASRGIRQQRFLQFISPPTTKSEDIYSAVFTCLNENGLDVQKLVSSTQDGASNMSGKKGDFTALLKKNIQ